MTTLAAIRQATPRDAFAVAALHLQWGREHGAAPEQGFLDRWSDAWLAECADRPFWLAEVDKRPLGVAGLHLVTALPRPGAPGRDRFAADGFLYVTPTFRRCGIAAQLTREVAAWSVSQRISRIDADTTALGAAASGIERRLGPLAARTAPAAAPRVAALR